MSPMENSGVLQTPTQGSVSYQQLYNLLPTLASSSPITVASSLFQDTLNLLSLWPLHLLVFTVQYCFSHDSLLHLLHLFPSDTYVEKIASVHGQLQSLGTGCCTPHSSQFCSVTLHQLNQLCFILLRPFFLSCGPNITLECELHDVKDFCKMSALYLQDLKICLEHSRHPIEMCDWMDK